MPGRTSTTRPKGSGIPAKGKGHGGPARGAGAPPLSVENQPAPEAKSAGWEVRAMILERIAERKIDLVDAQLKRAIDPHHPQGHQAASYLLDKLIPPESKTTVSMTMNPDDMTDAELAAIAAGGRAPAAGTASGQE